MHSWGSPPQPAGPASAPVTVPSSTSAPSAVQPRASAIALMSSPDQHPGGGGMFSASLQLAVHAHNVQQQQQQIQVGLG
jgi:hypothetical protein